ncbi:MAG: esterase-like activity of phytase family protein [Saprospiraceae bacterium]
MNHVKMIAIAIILATTFGCNDDVTIDGNAVSTDLIYTDTETYGNALADQVTAGDGAGIDNTFRNSGVVINEADDTYFAVNGVHPVNGGDYTSYNPKSVVKASLTTDEVVQAFPFSGVNGHEVDMEALTFGPEDGYLYIGDEYNYIYKMNLTNGDIEEEWDLSEIGVSTNVDKGIEAITYSAATGAFYVGIQDLSAVIAVTLGENGAVTKGVEFAVADSPSGLFAHADGSLYVLTFSAIYQFSTDGTQSCQVSIPDGLGMTRPDGIYIDSNNEYIYLADSQGPLNGGHSMYKIGWTKPCD